MNRYLDLAIACLLLAGCQTTKNQYTNKKPNLSAITVVYTNEIDNLHVEPWYNKALCLIYLKKQEEAKKVLTKVLEIDPNYTKAKDRLDELEHQ